MIYELSIRKSIVVLALAGVILGCNPFRRRPRLPPPPPDPLPQIKQIPPKRVPPQPLPSPPLVDETPVEVPDSISQTPEPPPPPVKAKARKRTPASVPAETVPEPDPQPPPVAASPLQLGTVLSDEQRVEYTHLVDQHLARAEAEVAPLRERSLSSDQSAALNRILSYMSQARENRDTDPALAARLAERAELLARDLAGSAR